MTPSLESAMLALSLTYWPFFTRIVYAETRRLRSALFVDALAGSAPATRASLFLHILPNAASPIIVRATIGLGSPSWSPRCWASSAWAPPRRRPTGA